MVITIKEDRDEVIAELMKIISKVANNCIQTKDVFTIGVSGGSLAGFLVIGLPKIETDFSKWKIFFCDERLVPEDDCDSTFGFYKSNLLCTDINLEENRFIKVRQDLPGDEAAEDYERQIVACFPDGTVPRFDMLLLGMGPDGHTCSLFPNHPLLKESKQLIAPITDSPKPPPSRITMTFPLINNAANCVFAISGKEKAEMVKKILVDKEDLPSTRVKPTNGNLYWILDEAAATHIKDKLI